MLKKIVLDLETYPSFARLGRASEDCFDFFKKLSLGKGAVNA
jgi:hypothetical protein